MLGYFFPKDSHRDLKTGPKVGPGGSAQNVGQRGLRPGVG